MIVMTTNTIIMSPILICTRTEAVVVVVVTTRKDGKVVVVINPTTVIIVNSRTPIGNKAFVMIERIQRRRKDAVVIIAVITITILCQPGPNLFCIVQNRVCSVAVKLSSKASSHSLPPCGEASAERYMK